MEPGQRSWCWGWCGIGALAALAIALASGRLRSAELAPPGPVVLWVADRDAGRLYGLDEDLILAARLPLAAPLDLARARDGRLYVLCAPGRLVELDARGAPQRELEVGTCLDLETQADCALLVQQPGPEGPRRAAILAPDEAPRTLLEAERLRCICGSLDSVLVGSDDGRVERLALANGERLGSVVLGGAIVDLAPAAEAGGAFALDGAGRRLLRLAPDLALHWQADLPLEARHLAPVGGEERVWLADCAAPRVLRYGPGGALELDCPNLPLRGLDRALAWSGGGVLLVAPGALLQLDRQGHQAPGQGGFNFLVALAR